jgi:competence protein ComEC
MDKSKFFLLFIGAFLAGIFVGWFYVEERYWEILVVICLTVVGVVSLFEVSVRAFLIFLMGLYLGALRLIFSFDLPENHISNYSGYVSFFGCVVEEVDVRSDKVKYVFEVEKVFLDGDVLARGRVLVIAPKYPQYNYGECFVVSGVQDFPEMIDDFDYAAYLARYNIYSILYRPVFEEVEEVEGGNVFFRKIFSFKRGFEGRMGRVFSEPHASFMAGLILGSRRGIPEHLMTDFNITGLTHIIAISGYNITLIIVIVSAMLGFLGRKKSVYFSAIFIVVFVVLVGASAAVVRAAIMGLISLLALYNGRQYFVTNALFIAAFLMNIYNPKILIFDVGFQLSFFATCGLVYVSPYIEKYFESLPKVVGIRESILLTISAQIFALPIIVYDFGRLSLISPFANLFVLPFIPLAMLFGFFATVFSFVFDFLGQFIGFFGYLILELIIFFVKLFATVPLASIEIGWFSKSMLIGYYLCLFFWLKKKNLT